MLASQRRERTARASYHDAAVAFDVCERAKMLVHQLTRRDRASFHTSRQAFSCGQFERQLPPRAAKQRLQLMTLQRLREHIDKMHQYWNVCLREELLYLRCELEDM